MADDFKLIDDSMGERKKKNLENLCMSEGVVSHQPMTFFGTVQQKHEAI